MPGFLIAQRRVREIHIGNFEALNGNRRSNRVAGIFSGTDQRQADGPIQETGIQIGIAEFGRQAACQGALTARRWAIDRDHDRHRQSPTGAMSAPRPVINSRNPGKLVSIAAASSIVTGFAEARPSTRYAMAIR